MDIIRLQSCFDKIAKCTIPAGSEYVIEGNEIVSNQIIIDEIF